MNSFGIDFDPITKKLWDTENGADFGDEINLVNLGFNSGWMQVQGIWLPQGNSQGPIAHIHPSKFVDFGGRGIYHPPQFTWEHTNGPTAIKFLNSSKLGKQYENDMFVADVIFGNIYHFKLNKQRDGLLLTGPLADRVANNADETFIPWFAAGFGAITDLQVGPERKIEMLNKSNTTYDIDRKLDYFTVKAMVVESLENISKIILTAKAEGYQQRLRQQEQKIIFDTVVEEDEQNEKEAAALKDGSTDNLSDDNDDDTRLPVSLLKLKIRNTTK